MNKLAEHTDLATKAGFTNAAKHAHEIADRARRLMMAYEHFRYVTEDQIIAFNAKLKEATLKRQGKAGVNLYHVYDTLKFVPAAEYDKLPPADVLEKVAHAKSLAIFDETEVCTVTSTREYKDPIVFGRINGCTDRFYIADWGDDIRITDLLGPNEG